MVGSRKVIRKYYGRSIVALLMIPVVVILARALFDAIDPELARGHADYARNYTLLKYLRNGTQLAALLLVGALWLLACARLLRAKSRRGAWLALALLGAPGFAALAVLSDHSPLAPNDAYGRLQARLPRPLRVLYEIIRFVAFSFVALQIVEWFDDATAILEATRRGVALATVLAERDASSGMWAFGDMNEAAYLFVLIYALWPAGCNWAARLSHRLRRGSPATDA
jgi:hypothetical protein